MACSSGCGGSSLELDRLWDGEVGGEEWSLGFGAEGGNTKERRKRFADSLLTARLNFSAM